MTTTVIATSEAAAGPPGASARLGTRARWPLALLCLGLALAGCGGEPTPQATEGARETGAEQSAAESTELFVDRTEESGIDFAHFNGMTGEKYFVEPVGPGAALFDYDNDGDLDLYIAQGALFPDGTTMADALFPSAEENPRGRLFRNDGGGGKTPRFVDVTDSSRIDGSGYAMGVAVGDYTNDGCPDLLLTNFGPNALWRNRCDGTFEDVTEATGFGDPRWSTSAVFFDLDNDGWLDVYLDNYVAFTMDSHKTCYAPSGRPDYCGPNSFKPLSDRLWRNTGDGGFEDISVPSGIVGEQGPALGVVATDVDSDGWTDLFVSNDLAPNFLWLNQGNLTLRNGALLAGTAVNMKGVSEASMGIGIGDVDNDGDEDIFLTHLVGETNTLYANDGTGLFEDRSIATRLGPQSVHATGFGAMMVDVDNDGWLDIVAANGAVKMVEALAKAGDPYPLHEPNQVFMNRRDGTFEDVSPKAGAALQLSEVTRGLASGDVDNDGDSDVVFANNNGPARLLINEVGAAASWLGVRAVGEWGSGELVGVKMRVTADGRSVMRITRADGSYLSANDPRVIVGLGDAGAEELRLSWPGGRDTVVSDPPERRYLVFRAGS